MLKGWKLASQDMTDKSDTTDTTDKSVYRSNNYLTGANYDTLSIRMEQTLSEVISLDSVSPNETSQVFNNSTTNATKQMWNVQIHIWTLVVELYLKLGQFNEAEMCISEGLTTIFRSPSHQLMYIRGFFCKCKGNLLEAKSLLQNAISINPRHAKALQQLGHTFYLLGNHMAADKYLRDSLNVDSTLHETWSYMGLVLDAMGDSSRAFDCQATALKLEASAPVLPFNVIPRAVLE